ncbi:MAG: hypothetical protein FH749_15880 [Firmicutes bacterium]|nr:hypothetical protein [Bacillota bacterium]
MSQEKYSFSWAALVPIFRNSTIMLQLAIAIGIPFGVLCIVLAAVGAWYGLTMIAALFLLTFLLIMAVYGGVYDVGYVLDSKGIHCYARPRQAKRNRFVNWVTVILGLLARQPAAAGAGLLAGSRQSTFLKWNNVRKVKYKPRKRVIIIRGGLTERVALFCSEDNYQQIAEIVRAKEPSNM